MGLELECKLAVADRTSLDRIICDTLLLSLAETPWRALQMHTTYYDTPEQLLRRLHWTLRLRLEGTRSLVCLKTPRKARYTCGEWQTEAQALDEAAIRRLVADGAPKELLLYTAQSVLEPVCGAAFLRRCVMLRFSDGSAAELAADDGILFGKTQQRSFTEIELELYDGAPEAMLAFAGRLCQSYGLQERRESKHMRARGLD